MAAILIPFGQLGGLNPRYIRPAGTLVRRSGLTGVTGISRNDMIINTGQNTWAVNAALLRQEWPQMYRQLRSTGNRVIRQSEAPLSAYQSVEDYCGESAAWENIMILIGICGGGLASPVPAFPPNPNPSFLQLCYAIQVSWVDPPLQAYYMQAMITLLDQMSNLLERSPGLQIPSNVVDLILQIGQEFTATAGEVSTDLQLQLISCLDRICGKDDGVLSTMLRGVRTADKARLSALCTALGSPQVLGGLGDTLSIRIGAVLYGVNEINFARVLGHPL